MRNPRVSKLPENTHAMKSFIRIAFLPLLLLLQTNLFANTVIVKGTVTDSANHPVPNRTVKIYSTDSSNNGCILSHTVITNNNGFYIDTLSCNGDIRKLAIIVENCNGVKITHDPPVTTSGMVESNFIICTPNAIPLSCKAAFSYKSLSNGIQFNGAGSAALPGDSIISRTWIFGDSSAALTGNRIDPVHGYSKPGIYQVCLTIKTQKGCSSSYCQAVVYTPASNDCQAVAAIQFEKIANKKFRFNSNQSTTLPGDSIFQRIWTFSDGSSLDGNQINPIKEFKDSGAYTVCLSIRTVKGCEKQICINLFVHDSIPVTIPNTSCKAGFTTSIQGKTVKFNSSNSSAPRGDSILSRIWIFGDSTLPMEGNRLDPSHVYQKAGKYTACLYIKTQSGCESKSCFDFTLTDSTNNTPPTGCKAYFTYTIKDSTVLFNSEGSKGSSDTDSIISRTWYYSDSSSSVSLGGNVIAPSHQYSKPGTYPVYLVIKTKGGCESRYNSSVVIRPQITPTTCKAYFTYTIKDSTIYFNSEGSKAASETDSIISRTWYYTDRNTSVSLGGNVIAPFYSYTKPGSYPVYLVIKTKNGCESKYVTTVTLQPKSSTECKAFFTYQAHNGQVYFTSSASHAGSAPDSILSRIWFFGDNTTPLQGNTLNPVHHYSRTGKFVVFLYIKTKSGCESKYTDTVSVTQTNCEAKAVFSSERISLKKVQFNSSLSATQNGDSIIQRIWKFGDNTILSGNEIKPVKEFPYQGIYNTCLLIRTLYGCEAQTCNPVMVQDSSNNAQNAPNVVKIISINPNPVITRMVTTIYSSLANTEIEISIFDIYGTVKYTVKKQLLKGNNVFELPTESLYHGPYFLRVNAASGKDSKAFYKL